MGKMKYYGKKGLQAVLLVALFFVTSYREFKPKNSQSFETKTIIDPDHISQPGKIWVKNNYLIVNDQFRGFHIFDITDPQNPVRKSFTLLSNNIDIGVYNDTLYADSYGNLVIYDISDITNPQKVKEISNVVTYNYDFFYTGDLDDMYYDDYSGFGCYGCFASPVAYDSDTGNSVNTGGSLARFAIVDNYLYTLKEGSTIKVFDITVSTNPISVSSASIPRWDAETLYHYEDYLFVGASSGVYIYSISNKTSPEQVGQFLHVRACDPVVVQSNVAYVTLRDASTYPWQRLELIDLKGLTNWAGIELIQTISLDNPYGLGVQDNYLYVCDGLYGLKIFGIANMNSGNYQDGITVYNSPMQNTVLYDVIPLGDYMVMTGGVIGIYSISNRTEPDAVSLLD